MIVQTSPSPIIPHLICLFVLGVVSIEDMLFVLITCESSLWDAIGENENVVNGRLWGQIMDVEISIS